IGLVPTTRTGLALVGATGRDDLWRWQVGNRGHPFGGIGSICTRTEHGCVLPARMLGSALYGKCPTGAIPKPGKDAIVSKNAGITKRASCHTLRHTFATYKAEKGVSPFQLQQWLGHANLNTTQIYVHLGKQNAKKIMEQTSLP